MTPWAKPSSVLVAVDLSPCSRRLVETAISWYAPAAKLTVVHVLDTSLAERLAATRICSFAQAMERLRAHAVSELEALGRSLGAEFARIVAEGVPALEIIKAATATGCGLIVIGSLGADVGTGEILFGSTAENVLRGAPAPVLCIPSRPSES